MLNDAAKGTQTISQEYSIQISQVSHSFLIKKNVKIFELLYFTLKKIESSMRFRLA